MSLRLRNRWNYKGDNRWEWEAFIDDNGTHELKDVQYVEYVLHRTFKNPVREIREKEGGFVLKTNGWGTFTLKAFINKKDNSRIKLDHEIVLQFDPPIGVSK